MQKARSILGRAEGLGSWGEFMTSSFQLVAA